MAALNSFCLARASTTVDAKSAMPAMAAPAAADGPSDASFVARLPVPVLATAIAAPSPLAPPAAAFAFTVHSAIFAAHFAKPPTSLPVEDTSLPPTESTGPRAAAIATALMMPACSSLLRSLNAFAPSSID